MGKAIPFAYRQKIVERRKSGESYESISAALGYSESGVKKIWYKYQKEGEAAFSTNYSNCGSHSPYAQSIHETVNILRDNQQGSSYIYSKFVLKHPNLVAPSARTLRRWWVKEQTNRKRGTPSSNEKKGGVNIVITLGK